jgi:hypothetical protein
MPFEPDSLPEHLLHTYFRAKDGNRPHLMSSAFSESATLEMRVKTGAIAFPPFSEGLDAITDLLVRRFREKFENVHSLYLDKPSPYAETFSCDWLVGMSEKASGEVYVGCGGYDWTFVKERKLRVAHLCIAIETMQVLPPARLDVIMAWLSALPYPWCAARQAAAAAPPISGIGPFLKYTGRFRERT